MIEVKNYAAAGPDANYLVRAYLRKNAVKVLQAKLPHLLDNAVYHYSGILSSSPVDELATKSEKTVNGGWVEVTTCKLSDEYKHLSVAVVEVMRAFDLPTEAAKQPVSGIDIDQLFSYKHFTCKLSSWQLLERLDKALAHEILKVLQRKIPVTLT